jgi:transketolase
MVGEDGPTHQPVEHVAALRLIPNLHVWRPADGPEVGAAWHATLTRTAGPVAMCLTRQDLPRLERPQSTTATDLARGGYVIRDAAQPIATILATGAEVAPVLEAADELGRRGKPVRVVSMPCVEAFCAQEHSYRDAVLGTLPVYAVEMGRPEIWCQFTGSLDRVIGFSRFGASAPGEVLAEHFGFTAAKLVGRLDAMIRPASPAV